MSRSSTLAFYARPPDVSSFSGGHLFDGRRRDRRHRHGLV